MTVDKSFFSNRTEKVAQKILGCEILFNGMKGRIVEAEAYLEDDPASHAYGEKTDRNRLMYETYGRIYIYKCYGIHNMLNFTADEDRAGGVLIRALQPLKQIEKMKNNRGIEEKTNLCDGPGKICEAFNITSEINGDKVNQNLKLVRNNSNSIESSTRIGISKATDRKLRFYEKDNQFVSTT